MIVLDLLNSVPWDEFAARHNDLFPDDADVVEGYAFAMERYKALVPQACGEGEYIDVRLEHDDYPEVVSIHEGSKELYALTFAQEEKVLGLSIKQELLDRIPPTDLLVYIMWEMCLHGFSKEDRDAARDKLNRALEAATSHEDDMFVSHGNVKVHRDAVDTLGMDGVEFVDFIEAFKERLKARGEIPKDF